jgi:hypothetical protein
VVPVDLQELLAGSHSEDLMAAIEIQPLEGLASISAAIHEVPTPIPYWSLWLQHCA